MTLHHCRRVAKTKWENRSMRRKLPSTTSLRAFDAAARHGNFSKAAEELSLTEGAISRQIARLEALLNCKLFDRMGSRVKLNPLGINYAHHVSESLYRMERDAQSIMGMPEESRSLDIAVLPTFSSRWLIPRLKKFNQLYPDITLNLAARADPFILSGSGFDAVIHYEHSAWAGMRVQFLFQENLLPICHPELLKNDGIDQQLNELHLIHRRQNHDAWLQYSQESGIRIDNPMKGRRYDLHEMAISAVIAGQGVALVPRMYVENELNNGSIISPWPTSSRLSKKFSLIKPQETGINETALECFERWLLSEVDTLTNVNRN